jgi:hypothetical protein
MKSSRHSPRHSLSERLERSRRHRQWLAKDSASSSVGGGSTGSQGTAQSEPSKPKGSAVPNYANRSERGAPRSISTYNKTNNNGEEKESLASRRQKAMQMGRKRNSYTPAPAPPTVPVKNNKLPSERSAKATTVPVSAAPKSTAPVNVVQAKRGVPDNSPSLTIDTRDNVVVHQKVVQSRSPAMQPDSPCDEAMLYPADTMYSNLTLEEEEDDPTIDQPGRIGRPNNSAFSRPNQDSMSSSSSSYTGTQGRLPSSYSGYVQPQPGATVTPSWVKKSASNDIMEQSSSSSTEHRRSYVKPGSSVAPSWAKRSDPNNVVESPSQTSNTTKKWTPPSQAAIAQSPQGQRNRIARTGSWSSPKAEAPRPSPMSASQKNQPRLHLGSASPRNESLSSSPPEEEPRTTNQAKAAQGSSSPSIETPGVMSVASLRASFSSRGSNQPIMPMNSPDPRVRHSFNIGTSGGSSSSSGPMIPKSPRPSWQQGRSHAPSMPTQPRTPSSGDRPPPPTSATSPSNATSTTPTGQQRYGSTTSSSPRFIPPSKSWNDQQHQPVVDDGQVDWPAPEDEPPTEERRPPSAVKTWQAKQGAPRSSNNNSTTRSSALRPESPSATSITRNDQGERNTSISHGRAPPSVLNMWQAKQKAPNSATDSIRKREDEAAGEPEADAPEGGGKTSSRGREPPSVLKMWQTKQGGPPNNSTTESTREAEVEAATEPEPEVTTGAATSDEELRPSNVLKMWHAKLGAKSTARPAVQVKDRAQMEERSITEQRQAPNTVKRWQSNQATQSEPIASQRPDPVVVQPDITQRPDPVSVQPSNNQERVVEDPPEDTTATLEKSDSVNEESVHSSQKVVVVAPEENGRESPVLENAISDEETRALYANRARQIHKSYNKAPWQHDSSPRRMSNDRESSFWRAKAEATAVSANNENTKKRNTASAEKAQAIGPAILPDTGKQKVPSMFSKTSPTTGSPNLVSLTSKQLTMASGDGPEESRKYNDEIERRALEIVGKLNQLTPASHDIVEEKKSSEDVVVQSDNDEEEDHSTRLARMAAESSLVADFEEVMKYASKLSGSFDDESTTNTGNYSGNPSALPEDLPEEFQRVLSVKSDDQYYLGVPTSFSMQDGNTSPTRLAIKESDSTSAYIEDENYVDDETSTGENPSPTRLVIKHSDSTSAYIEDDANYKRESFVPAPLDTDLLPTSANSQEPVPGRQPTVNSHNPQPGHSNVLSPTKSMDSSNYPVLTPSRRDSDAYKMGYFGDASPRGKTNASPPKDQKSTISPPLRTANISPSSGRGKPQQVDQVLRFWAKETASEDEHNEALSFTGEDEWGDKDPDLMDPFADDDSDEQENKGPEKMTTRFSNPSAPDAMQTEMFKEPQHSKASSRGGQGRSFKKPRKKKEEKVVFDPFADDDEDVLILDNPDDFFSPGSADPFMTAESFSPLNWGTPRSQDISDFNRADISPEFQAGFEI